MYNTVSNLQRTPGRLSARHFIIVFSMLLLTLSNWRDGSSTGLASIEIPPEAGGAEFPFFDGFETGSLGPAWSTFTSQEGRVRVLTNYSHTGLYSLVLDDSALNMVMSEAAAILTFDFTGQAEVELEFWLRRINDYYEDEGVYISDDLGVTWHPIFFFSQAPKFWRKQVFDLDQAASAKGLTLTEHFQIRFYFHADKPIEYDGYAIDDVRVGIPPLPVPASLPFQDDFESGDLGAAWITRTTNEGLAAVTNSYPYQGAYSLVLHDTRLDMADSEASAILAVDLLNKKLVDLKFRSRRFGEQRPEDGVYLSDDLGVTWHQVLQFLNDPIGWSYHLIHINDIAASEGLALNEHFYIKFHYLGNKPINYTGYAIDNVQVAENSPPELLWSGTLNYEQDGLHPEAGDIRSTYQYRIKYRDIDGDAPDFVQVEILDHGTPIAGSPFAMDCLPGAYNLGVVCSYDKLTFPEGSSYSYRFNGADSKGNLAVPTGLIDAPDVTAHWLVMVPVVLKDFGLPSPPVLSAISNLDGDNRYTVQWSKVDGATGYRLQEDNNPSFSSPTVVYSGSNRAKIFRKSSTGTYYYRVQAYNQAGDSAWSNAESVTVTKVSTCPYGGEWNGTTNWGDSIKLVIVDSPGCYVASIRLYSSPCGGDYMDFYGDYEITNSSFTTGSETMDIHGTFSNFSSLSGGYYIRENCGWGVWSIDGTFTAGIEP